MLVYFSDIWYFYAHLVNFLVIWYIFPALVLCIKKNLASPFASAEKRGLTYHQDYPNESICPPFSLLCLNVGAHHFPRHSHNPSSCTPKHRRLDFNGTLHILEHFRHYYIHTIRERKETSIWHNIQPAKNCRICMPMYERASSVFRNKVRILMLKFSLLKKVSRSDANLAKKSSSRKA
jgi:hypothetical protein